MNTSNINPSAGTDKCGGIRRLGKPFPWRRLYSGDLEKV